MRIGVFGRECNPDKLPVVKGLFNKLNALGADVYIRSGYAVFLGGKFNYHPENVKIIDDRIFDLDIVLSVGGDGTFLRTALEVNKQNIPILGINTGRLGFLADIGSNQIDETLDELFRGDYKIEERSLLRMMDIEERAFDGFHYALNEVAILKRDTSSMITVHTYLNDDYLTSYVADGLIIATPTGSTAYSMSVNGPILLPQNRNFILSPVAPHSLNVRPIVIPDNYIITLNVESRTNSFLASLDGRSEDFPVGTVLKISKAEFSTLVIKRFNQTFYQTLHEKLMWGTDVRS
ncbi:MAG: NAD kinase [Tannerella sp.]|jgi:NAD+ kinase|nr:NAD kinase [Tannerella sp.]